MHSLKTKITAVMISAIVITMIIAAVFGVIAIRNIGISSSEQMLLLLCEAGQKNLDSALLDIEQEVQAISAYVESDLDGTDDLKLQAHLDRVSDFFKKVLYKTNGVMTYYYRIDPAVSSNVKGFWFVMIVIAFIALLAAFITFILRFTERITKPLQDLTKVAEQIGEGNYDHTLDYDEDDEIGILTRTFSRVTANLKKLITELNDLTKQLMLQQESLNALLDNMPALNLYKGRGYRRLPLLQPEVCGIRAQGRPRGRDRPDGSSDFRSRYGGALYILRQAGAFHGQALCLL